MEKKQLDKNNIIGILGEGAESTVYFIKNNNKYSALKLFKNSYTEESFNTLMNKEKKLVLLSESPLLSEEEKPLNLYYKNDQFVGYSMPIDYLIDLEYHYTSSKRIKLELLKKLRDRIAQLNENGIYIGDLNIRNFGIKNDGTIKLRDIDNFSIDNLHFDRPTYLVEEYNKRCKSIENVDNYSFNYFSLGYYMSKDYVSLIKYLKEKGLPKKFDTEENRKLLFSLENIDDNYKKGYFIDNQKKGLFK